MTVPDRCVVVHYEEIALKGKNRGRFEKILARNLKDLAGVPARARILPGRILVIPENPEETPAVAARAARAPGVAFAAESIRLPLEWDVVEQAASRMAREHAFKTFAVRASRQDKSLPFRSRDIEVRLGNAVQQATGARVDLDHPEFTLFAECLSRQVILSAGRCRGPGGLPAGSAGRVLCLLSGGIDSPVAAFLMMTRGCLVDFVHFHSFPFVKDRQSAEKCRRLAGVLAGVQGRTRLVEIAIGEAQQRIAAESPAPFRTLLYRRLMLETASGVARASGAKAIVTGDSLGQVASQTLENLAAVTRNLASPVFQPLVGLGKREITRIAKEIGTYDVSIETQEDCCRFLEPGQAETHSDPEAITRLAETLGIPELAARLAAGTAGAGAPAGTIAPAV